MFHKSIGDTDHHSHVLLYSDLTSYFIVHAPQSEPLKVGMPDKF